MNQVDYNDVIHVIQTVGNPIGFTVSNPTATDFIFEDKMVSVFHCKPIYYKHLNGEWRPLSEVASHYGSYITLKEDWEQKMDLGFLAWLMKVRPVSIPSPKGFLPLNDHILFTSTDFFSVPSSGAIDGDIYKDPSASWAGARDSATGDAAQVGLDQDWICYSDHPASTFGVMRGFHFFDTSSITSAATVTAATISIMGGNPLSRTDTNSCSVHIVASSVSDTTTLTTANFNAFSFSSLGSWTFASMTQDVYSSTAISDLTTISKTGVSKFAAITDRDLNNSTPTGANEISGYYSGHTGTSKDPKLTVTFTLPSGNRMMLLGVN